MLRKITRTKMNKKGDIPSLLYAIIAIFVVGILLFFLNHITPQLYDSLDDYLETSDDYNTTEIRGPLDKINTIEKSSIWDYAFLAIVFAYFGALALTGYSTRISPLFFWFYGIAAIIGLILSVMLANTWQELASNPEFATTITRFPIANLLLGSYYPIFVTVMIVVVMILLFGKFPGDER